MLGRVCPLERAELDHARGRAPTQSKKSATRLSSWYGKVASVRCARRSRSGSATARPSANARSMSFGPGDHSRPRSARTRAAARRTGAVARQLSEPMTPARSMRSCRHSGPRPDGAARRQLGGGCLARRAPRQHANAQLADVLIGPSERLRQKAPMLVTSRPSSAPLAASQTIGRWYSHGAHDRGQARIVRA